MPSPPPSIIQRVAGFFEDWWPTAVTTAGGIVLATLGLADNSGHLPVPAHPSKGWLFAVGALLAAVGVVASGRRKQAVTQLRAALTQSEREAARSRLALIDLARVELGLLASELKYLSSERISLFVRGNRCLELVARHSANWNYVTSVRTKYLQDQGILGQAWAGPRGDVVIPEHRSTDEEAWLQGHIESGLSRTSAASLRMPTRSVFGLRIDDPRVSRQPLGVLILESEQTAQDEAVGGPPTAALDWPSLDPVLSGYEARLAGILSVFAELAGEED